MIISTFTYVDEKIKHVSIKGHANYDTKGKDILCAAVSTAILVTANAMELLSLNQHVDLTIKEGYFKLDVKTFDQTNHVLLTNLEYTLLDLEKQYPNYMKNQKEG